ncbi:SDR family oxidoreductase [Rhizobium laguerreae]|uniref:SDR family oxidoreductase n=1 Tax=Rhizobium laguerreae TaxID=1076926 RepID=UPI001FE9FCE7|nr:aldehyde reductase [Rhizobium laguerreae]
MSITSDNSNGANVLVTGIGGFLAGHIALQLLKQGYRVRGSLRSIGTSAATVGLLGAHTDGQLQNLSLVQADLDSDGGWAAAVEGCDYVIHTASPFPPGYPENENALIQTARDGALRVLREAHRARVKRVVLTSSVAATNHGDGRAPFTEENWTDPESPRATPYYKSKTLTERAAWAFAHEVGLDLAVINPSTILGPLLGPNFGTSVGLIHHLMTGRFNGIPRFGFSVVDVRDTADAHIRAMTNPAASRQRFIIGGRFFWLKDLVAILAHSFPTMPPACRQAKSLTRSSGSWRNPTQMHEPLFMSSIATSVSVQQKPTASSGGAHVQMSNASAPAPKASSTWDWCRPRMENRQRDGQ